MGFPGPKGASVSNHVEILTQRNPNLILETNFKKTVVVENVLFLVSDTVAAPTVGQQMHFPSR